MNGIKLSILAAAVVVGIPVACALVAQQFGSENVIAEARRGDPATLELKRFGGHSVFLAKDALITRPEPTRFADFTLKPGRA